MAIPFPRDLWSASTLCATLLLPVVSLAAVDRDVLEEADFGKTVTIVFNGTAATVTDVNGAGVTVATADSSAVAITSDVPGVKYILSGTTTAGYFQLTSTYRAEVVLDGVSITSGDGPALSVLGDERAFLVLADGTTNTLVDSAKYSRTGKGAVHTGDSLLISGSGAVTITANGGHGIYTAGGDVRVFAGSVTVAAATKDAIHPSDLCQIDGGTITLTPTGDGIDAAGGVILNGGKVSFSSSVADVKGLKSDAAITINGGIYTATVAGDQSKAISATTAATITGGALFMDLSGAVVLESVTADDSSTYIDPSYCTAIKCDADIAISGGHIVVTHSGTAGKGISADGTITITGGTIDIATSGDASSTYTNEDGDTDCAAADCLKADGNLVITAGTITVRSTGIAGDAISCDGAATIGTLGVDSTPVITASTSGARLYLYGSGDSAEYSNPKAFSAEGDVTVNGGSYTATTSTEGGEGLESKANLTINGGALAITTYDDAINAATSITINGGYIYAYASGNDGIDSNGTLTITGGVIVSSGTTTPEEGFDCDTNTFAITGGLLIGTGGSTSTPTSASCDQCAIIYKGTATSGLILEVRTGTTEIFAYEIPRAYTSSLVMLFSSPSFSQGSTYTIRSGGTISGGTEFHGLHTGATVTGGTQIKSFTTSSSSMVTTVQ